MKGFRFYAEMPEGRRSKAASKAHPMFPWTVAALRGHAARGGRAQVAAVPLMDNGRPCWTPSGSMDAIAMGIEGNPLSYTLTTVDPGYLRQRCIRIPEDLARHLSPELFAKLEA